MNHLRIFSFAVLVALASGCGKTSAAKSGDLSAYLNLTKGTPVIIHLEAKDTDGKSRDGVFARGTIYSISRDEVRIQVPSEKESIGYVKEIVQSIEIDKQ